MVGEVDGVIPKGVAGWLVLINSKSESLEGGRVLVEFDDAVLTVCGNVAKAALM